jgi:hypothetical protein
MEKAMVEATQAYHPKVLTAIRLKAERIAREEVEREIKGRGQRITDYLPKDIRIMALARLCSNPGHHVARAKASRLVALITAEEEAKERRKAQRRTGHTLGQSVTTPSEGGGVSQ